MWTPFKINEQIAISEMFSFFEAYYENGYNFQGETHNFWECVYVMDGCICVSGDERVYNLSRGEIIFHKPMELHKFHVNNEKGAKLLIFSFSATGELTEFMKDKVFNLSFSQKEIIDALIKYIRKNQALPHLDKKELQYLNSFSAFPMYSQMVTTYIVQLLLSLGTHSSVSEMSSAPDALIFNKAVNFMIENICNNISLENISAHCNISNSSLKRIFAKYSGIGVHKYFFKLKIKVATEMLEKGYTVSNVAQTFGFSSQAYFSRAFKRETGLCASAVKQYKNNL